jgi:hypothetical protein
VRNIDLLLKNILSAIYKKLMLLTLVPQKLLFIININNTLKLAFNHFDLSQFMDLEGSGRRGGKGGLRARNKGCFF